MTVNVSNLSSIAKRVRYKRKEIEIEAAIIEAVCVSAFM
jgi:hypothetical protein